jgi:hypothetical protein
MSEPTTSQCLKCEYLSELYKRTPKSERDYWVMTELFVMLHGGDICRRRRMNNESN